MTKPEGGPPPGLPLHGLHVCRIAGLLNNPYARRTGTRAQESAMTERDHLTDPPTNLPSTPRKVVVASLIGTSLEWYDFFLYGTGAALVFNQLFFPGFDPAVGPLLPFAPAAVGFVARPLGGIVFGH